MTAGNCGPGIQWDLELEREREKESEKSNNISTMLFSLSCHFILRKVNNSRNEGTQRELVYENMATVHLKGCGSGIIVYFKHSGHEDEGICIVSQKHIYACRIKIEFTTIYKVNVLIIS